MRYGLRDYFSKYGFRDGDCPKAVDWAYAHQDLAVRLLTEEMVRAGVPDRYRVCPVEMGGCHNPVRMVVVDTNPPDGFSRRDPISCRNGGRSEQYTLLSDPIALKTTKVEPLLQKAFDIAAERFAAESRVGPRDD